MKTSATSRSRPSQKLSPAEKTFLASPGKRDTRELLAIWRERAFDASTPTLLLEHLAEQLLKRGEPLMANEILDRGLEWSPDHRRFRQLAGLALARCGSTTQARHLLEGVYHEGDRSEETLGLLGRIHKDLGLGSSNSAEQKKELNRALAFYLESFTQHENAYWTGINAATISFLLGKKSESLKLAKAVDEMCRARLADKRTPAAETYWLYATLGECALISRKTPEAVAWYQKAGRIGRGRWGDLASTKRNARLLLQTLGQNEELLADGFAVPPVMLFTGHMIDRPDRPAPRFPAEIEKAVATELRKVVAGAAPGFGYASAACGGDILFLEQLHERGAETTIILPFDADRFLETSVAFPPRSAWVQRFHGVMADAHAVSVASPGSTGETSTTYEYANLLLLGKALERAQRLETRLIPVALWDEKPGDGPGGTAGMVELCRQRGLEVEIINPLSFIGRSLPRKPAKKADSPAPTPASAPRARSRAITGTPLKPEIRAVLFGDAVHFSKLSETQLPLFINEFLAMIGEEIVPSRKSVRMRNTWGDGLFFVFDEIREAGTFSLRLAERLSRSNWAKFGLPETLNLRLALHVGPVLPFLDPVTGRENFLGTHVNQAARMEPITPPGQVYASESFMALTLAAGVTDFAFEYVGKVPLAKGYGAFPLYHLRPVRP